MESSFIQLRDVKVDAGFLLSYLCSQHEVSGPPVFDRQFTEQELSEMYYATCFVAQYRQYMQVRNIHNVQDFIDKANRVERQRRAPSQALGIGAKICMAIAALVIVGIFYGFKNVS